MKKFSTALPNGCKHQRHPSSARGLHLTVNAETISSYLHRCNCALELDNVSSGFRSPPLTSSEFALADVLSIAGIFLIALIAVPCSALIQCWWVRCRDAATLNQIYQPKHQTASKQPRQPPSRRHIDRIGDYYGGAGPEASSDTVRTKLSYGVNEDGHRNDYAAQPFCDTSTVKQCGRLRTLSALCKQVTSPLASSVWTCKK